MLSFCFVLRSFVFIKLSLLKICTAELKAIRHWLADSLTDSLVSLNPSSVSCNAAVFANCYLLTSCRLATSCRQLSNSRFLRVLAAHDAHLRSFSSSALVAALWEFPVFTFRLSCLLQLEQKTVTHCVMTFPQQQLLTSFSEKLLVCHCQESCLPFFPQGFAVVFFSSVFSKILAQNIEKWSKIS